VLLKKKKKKLEPSRSQDYFLKTGDIVDIVAPGSSCSKEIFESAVIWLKAQGFVPRFPNDIFDPEFFVSNSDEKRLKYFIDALRNKESKAVWCLRGGYGSIRLVPELLKIKKLPRQKLFIGYSDMTTLHLWLNQKMNWPTIHGPLLDRCGQNQLSEQNKNELLSLLAGQKNEIYFSDLKPLNLSARKKNLKLSGRIFGGNLSVFCSSLGTALQPQVQNDFLFFEDIGERGYRIDKMLNQISQSGLFKKCKAVFLGDFILGDESNGENHVWYALEKFFEKSKVPVFSGLQSGHAQIQRPLILNGKATLTCGKDLRLLTSF
jgi:muramoyltetrapeptide carboxypeptidase